MPRPRTQDGWIALGFAVAAAVEAVVRSRDATYLAISLTGAPLLLLLALRRSRPLLALALFCAGAVAGTALQSWLIPHASSDAFVPILAMLLLMYSVGAHSSGRQLVAAAPLPLLVVLIIDTSRPHSDSLISAVVFFVIFVVAVPLGAGRLVRGRAMLVERLEAQGRELDEQRSASASAALAEERLRLAEELDVELADGVQRLLTRLDPEHAPGDLAQVAAVEAQARDLLARTREVVVALTAEGSAEAEAEAEAEAAPPARRATSTGLTDAAQPWICLAAASVAAGLMVELRTAPVYVPRPVAATAAVVLMIPLALAWARPLLATAVVWSAAAMFAHQVAPLQHLTSPIALVFVLPFMVAALESRPRAVAGLACCWLGILATDGAHALPGDAVVASLCWIAGAGFRARTLLVERLRANNVLLEQGRAALAAQALREERTRLARELHDAVGHALTVVALQAGAARRIWDSDRCKAEAMIEAVRVAAVSGLRGLREGLLTTLDTPGSVDELIERARAAGQNVSAEIGGGVADLPAQHLQAIYRIVQEALTNALKHAPGAAVTVSLRCTGALVHIHVTNGPPGEMPAPVQRSGHGLTGMRHRLDQLGGSLSHERTVDGGFAVRAQLPLTPVLA